MNGSPEFHAALDRVPARVNELLSEMRTLHERKAADYGHRGGDPLANCRASEKMGITPWVGVALRMGDKWHRIESFIKNNELVNESLEDSFIDQAAYALIALVLYRETK